jgi:drug/metabolite transporter (DMT)-like permease
MALLLAIGAALGWGASDFFGGDASRGDTPVLLVVAIAEAFGIVLLAPVVIARGVAPPADPRLLLAAPAGVAVTVELSLIYRALSDGNAFITAPTGALGTAAAVTIGLISGDPLDLAVALGLACALLGGAVSAWTAPSPGAAANATGRTILTCLGAAAAVAMMLTSLHAAGRVDPYWATMVEHAATGLSAVLAARGRRRGRGRGRARARHAAVPARGQLPKLALIAAGGAGGDLAYAIASQHGALSIVSAISALYPLTTIALARLLRDQRATRVQIAGAALALTGAAVLGAARP